MSIFNYFRPLDAASPKFLNLIDNAGKEAGRDWLLVSTLEARKDEKQVILARNVLPCWFKVFLYYGKTLYEAFYF